MDSELIRLIARLKVRMRQDMGVSLNTQRFFDEREYALEALDRAEESENVEVVITALELRDRMGWLRSARAGPDGADADSQGGHPASETIRERYKFGARGG